MGNFRDYLKTVVDEAKVPKKHRGMTTQQKKDDRPKTVKEDEKIDFDYSNKNKSKLKGPFGNNTDAMSLQGRADVKQRVSNARYGDNPMEDDVDALEEDRQSMLDTLHDILKRDGASDTDIISGIQFSEKEKQKIAGRLGTSAHEIETLLTSLVAHLQSDNKKNMIQEFGETPNERYSFEADGLGSLTLRDSETGENKFLQGSEATDLANQIERTEGNPAKLQQMLKQIFLSESVFDNFFLNEEESFDKEIASDSGTYNMPWEINGERGFMTVFFTEKDGKPDFSIQSVRDEEGEELEFDAGDMGTMPKLIDQAKTFIQKEFS